MTLMAERSGTASAGPAAMPVEPADRNTSDANKHTPHASEMGNFNIFGTRN